MTPLQYATGVAYLGVLAAILGVTGWRARRGALPDWGGPPARLAEVTVAVGILVLTSQLLGVVGLFRRWPLLAAVAMVGVVAWVTTRSGGTARRSAHPPQASPSSTRVALALSALVFAQWIAFTIASLDTGILDVDSRQYHLPFAAVFARGWTTQLHYAWLDPTWSFYPANSELLHATGMLAFNRDVLSPVLNLGWLAVALLAGWCIGRPWGVGPATMAAVAVVAGTPLMATAESGAATNDFVVVALLLAAIAFLVTPGGDRPRLVLAGVAAGLAIGTKLTAIIPVVALALAVLVAARHHERVKATVWFGVPLFLGGGFWYLRNLVRAGNPVPQLSFGLPTPKLPVVERYGYRVVDYAGNSHFWRSVVPTGIRQAFGNAWLLLLLIGGIGVVGAILCGPSRFVRMLGVMAIISAIGYAITPGSAYGPKGNPFLFNSNLRYAVPPLALGLVLFPLVARWWRPARAGWALAVLVVLVLVNEPSAGPIRAWPTQYRGAALAVTLGVVIGIGVWTALWSHRKALAAFTLAVLALAAGAGYKVQRHYLDRRYTTTGPVDAWARSVRSAPIGMTGYAPQYPLFGLDLSNQVSYIGRQLPHGGLDTASTCAQWRSDVNRGRYTYVVAGTSKWGIEPVHEPDWARNDPNAAEVVRSPSATVFHIRGPLDPFGCG